MTPSLPAQIEAVRWHLAHIEQTAPKAVAKWSAVLATLQQHERDDTRIKQLDDECQRFMREVALLREQHERLEAALKQIPDLSQQCRREAVTTDGRQRAWSLARDIGNLALAALDSAAPPSIQPRSDHIERLEAVVKAARDLLRYAGIKHPGADHVIVSRERVHTLGNALAALDAAAPDAVPA